MILVEFCGLKVTVHRLQKLEGIELHFTYSMQ